MIAPIRGSQLREEVREAYLSGLSIWNVMKLYPQVGQRELRNMLSGIIRPKNRQRTADPSADEVVAKREEIKAKWTDEEARRRWVGRYSQSATRDPGSYLSALLRDMGGEG
jgi:hypothetical protein